jgi:hypothetical protein
VSSGLVSSRVVLSKPVYEAGGVLLARISLLNSSERPLSLEFRDGQRVDLAVLDEQGEQIALWSKGQMFPQVVGTELIGLGERGWTLTLPLADLPVGKYVAEGWITAANAAERAYSARVGFEVVEKK